MLLGPQPYHTGETDTPEAVGEGAVSGNQVSIPAAIRERADVSDGDRLRWFWEDGELDVEIVRRRRGAFEDFEGYEPTEPRTDPDLAGLEPAGSLDAGDPRNGSEE